MAKIKSKEELIQIIMRECAADGEPVTEEEAAEMAEMEIKASHVKLVAKSDEPEKKARKPREVKRDAAKLELMKIIRDALETAGIAVDVTNEQREMSFDYSGANFSVVLTKHKKKVGA